MNDAASVCVLKRLANLLDYFKSPCFGETAAARCVKNFGKRSSVQPLHDDEIQIVVTIEVYESHDVRMRQASAFSCLLL